MELEVPRPVVGSDLGETPTLSGPPVPKDDPPSDLASALRDQLALLERNQRRPIGERKDDLLNALPPFIQLFQNGKAGADLNLQLLATQSAEMLVSNVRQKLWEKPAEEARSEVELFFRTTEEGETGDGYLLLQGLALLSASESETVRAIVKGGVPAALIKCLYLFVSVPPREEGVAEQPVQESFQDLFTQVLLQLCRPVECVEEVVETQELHSLIIALTSLWDQCSATWRRQASRVLRAVSTAQAKNTVPALLAKNCIKICIQNLLKMPAHVPGPLLAEVAVGVFGFVVDSYPADPGLFDEFESNEGYAVLRAIMTRCEAGVAEADVPALEEFLGLIASLTLCGKAELKVALCVNDPQPPGFKFDPVLTEGSSVKNLPAFRILQSAFQRSEDPHTCCQILLAVRNIWMWDKANFFLLEWTLQSLAQLAECVWLKPPPVHGPFFGLLEMAVLQLSYIPHEALRKVREAALGPGGPAPFRQAALASFGRLCDQCGLFCDVLRDSGALELLLNDLRRHARALRKAGVTGNGGQASEDGSKKTPAADALKVVAAVAQKSVKNTVFIRDYGMIPYIKIFLDEEEFRRPALVLLEQLSVINTEEYMSTCIGALCSSTQTELGLKRDLLQSMLKVLESPNSCNAFRTAGGFDGVLSLLADMEGALRARLEGAWAWARPGQALELVLLGLTTVAAAVHLHPVNAHFFRASGQHAKVADALLRLGCFRADGTPPGHDLNPDRDPHPDLDPALDRRTFRQLVEAAETSGTSLPPPFRDCMRILAFLDRFATGSLVAVEIPTGAEEEEEGSDLLESPGRTQTASNSDAGRRLASHQTIVHPEAVCITMTVLPQISSREHAELVAELRLAVADRVQALVKAERNRQLACEAGLPQVLLDHCGAILGNTHHPLHLPVVRVFEKLASQAINPTSLRKFLCLGSSLTAAVESDLPSRQETDTRVSNGGHSGDVSDSPAGQKPPGIRELKHSFSLLSPSSRPAVPHHRTVSLVSMTSPRSLTPHKLSVSPSFVEFDMSDSGFGCLFLSSLATVKGVSADSISTGGTGTDCRGFPPSAGLSFSCWFLVSRFGPACDSHPIRLLTVVRHMSRAEQQFVCLSISLTAADGCLVISTEEEAYQFLDMMEPEAQTTATLPSTVRFACAERLEHNQWHHLTVALAKDVKKSCLVTLYLNSKMLNVAKMKYIQPFPGPCVSMDPTAVIDVCGIIGTPSLWKQRAPLIWRVGPAYLWEEAVSSESVELMYNQGTKYLGNYLSVSPSADGPDRIASPVRLVPEERISFGINPAVSSVTTVAEIRERYSEVDCRLIAKEMGITSRDSCTPVFLARNLAQHLSGTSRTIGAALVGRFGVRTFASSSAADSFLYVGGPAVLLSLVAMATNDSSLYAAAKVLLSVLSTSPRMEREMDRTDGYKLLAFLLKAKPQLISHRTFQLVLAITGTVELGSDSILVQNISAFRDILCDFEVWQNAPDNLDLLVLNHFDDILKSSSDDGRNAEVLHSLDVTMRLLFLLNDPTVSCQKTSVVSAILLQLLSGGFNTKDACRLGLFLVYTLLPPSLDENAVFSDVAFDVSSQALSQMPAKTIWIRNRLLETLLSLIGSPSPLSLKVHEELFLALGPDWLLLFVRSHVHSSTVALALRLLLGLLSCPAVLTRFQNGVSPGALLDNVARESSVVTDNLRAQCLSHDSETSSCPCPGFDVLQWLLVCHVAKPEVYVLLAALLLRKRGYKAVTEQEDLDTLLQGVLDSEDNGPGLQLCPDAAHILLELVKVVLSKPSAGSKTSWEMQFPGSVMRFFRLVYTAHPRDPLWRSPDFLNALTATVFPSPRPLQTDTKLSSQNGLASAEVQPTPPLPPPKPTPVQKEACDFARVLLMDSLQGVTAGDGLHPFTLLLEFSPEMASQEQKQSFQLAVLDLLMDIVRVSCQEECQAAPVARDGVASGERSVGRIAVLADNVAFFGERLVEKLYEGTLTAEPEKVLPFLSGLIVAVMEKAPSRREKTVSALYDSANRALLFFLSRRRQTRAELQSVVETLSVLQQRWDVLMATYNASVGFLTCLLHCLLILRSGSYPEGFGCDTHRKQPKKTWFPLLSHKPGQPSPPAEAPDSTPDESELQALLAAVWTRLMDERRRDLEQGHKMEVSAKLGARDGPVGLADISPLLEETAIKAWQLFIDTQRKAASSRQNKMAAHGAGARSARRTPGKAASCTVQEYLMCMEAHRKTAQEMFERLLKNHVQTQRCENDAVAAHWQRVEEDLLRERGLFGPGPGVFLKRGWVQDASEGPGRMRPRIRRKAPRRSKKYPASNPGFCGKWSFVDESRGMAETSDTDSEPKILCEAGQEVQENGLDCDQLTFFPSLSESSPPCEDFPQRCSDTQRILRELEHGEQVTGKRSVVVVRGHVVTEGVLLFGREHFYVCEGFALSPAGDVHCKTHHPTSSVRDAFVREMLDKATPSAGPSCRRYPYQEVKDARFARFLLEDSALEIFMRSGQSMFLVFQNKEHLPAFRRLCSIVPSLKGRAVADGARKAAGREKAALRKWQRGEMSNFEYLMCLNTAAGRTYNDLMQYPIFPWVLADYDSKAPDLSSPATFRDLSKPMGAQTDKRREKFIERYNEVESNDGDLSARCHYCTHYSSAIIVASFLVRMEPFSQTFLALQGGSFDVADRMFYSVKKEWESASRDNMSDVRELIPEFYYLPDFLVNSNSIELGCLQDGTPLGDVHLPPWAKGDPQEFVRVQREALESDYVSSHLHLWIDLIFGWKQRGQAAVDAVNAFHPYFYADTLEPGALTDPLQRSTVLGYVSNFGQIPRQLFTKPHPHRDAWKKTGKDQPGAGRLPAPFFHRPGKLKPPVQPAKELIHGPVGHMVCLEKDVLAVEKNKVLIPPLWDAFFAWGFPDNTCAYGNYSTEKSFAVSESPSDWGESLCAAFPDPTTVIVGGSSSVLCVWDVALGKDKLQHMRLKQVLYGHTDAVTCVEASEAYGVIVSGSRDQTCILWDLQELSYITQLPGHAAGITALAINDLTGEIASCAGEHLYLWTATGQPLSSIDTSFGLAGAILCCCFTQLCEWDPRNAIVTGCADGIVRIWKTEYTRAGSTRDEGSSASGSSSYAAQESTGPEWQRHLVLSQELNRSQSASRRRYKNNPAVTALAVSRDHSSLFVGDAWGRVFSWTCES